MSTPEELPTHWLPGAIIAGRFEVVRILGVGGMGAVLEAQNVALGQRVAVKVLRRELVNDKEAHARFDQEARVVSQLSTEHVVRVHDLGRTEKDEPYIVMELLAGSTIDDLIEQPIPVGIQRAVDLVAEACVGLAVAHAAHVVHRDIKPANLFIARKADGSEVVKVLDFGLTKVTRKDELRLTSTATVFGTPLYMSPEQIMSAKNVDARTDQHAIAMVLFEVLTKSPPYYDETATALSVKIATGDIPSAIALRAEVPQGLDDAIRRALAKAPNNRFEDVAAFALAIAPFGSIRAQTAASRAAAALSRDVVIPAPATSTQSSGPDTVGQWTTRRAQRRASRVRPIAITLSAVLGIAGAVALSAKLGGSNEPASAPTALEQVPASAVQSPAGTVAESRASADAPVSEPSVTPAASASAAPSSSAVRAATRPASKKPPAPTAAPAPMPPKSAGEYIPKYSPKPPG